MVQNFIMDILRALEIMGFTTLEGLTSDMLKARYKERAKEHHPDKNGGDNLRFVDLSNAYTTLKDIVSVQDAMTESMRMEKSARSTSEHTYTATPREEKKDTVAVKNALVLHKKALRKHKEHIEKAKIVVSKVTAEHLHKQEILRHELDLMLAKLRAEYQENWLRKLFVFMPSKNQKNMADREDTLIGRYESIKKELDAEFYHQLVKIYGESLNQIQKNLSDIVL